MDIKIDMAAVLSAFVMGLFVVLGFLLKNRLGRLDHAIDDLYANVNDGAKRISRLEGINEGEKNHNNHGERG